MKVRRFVTQLACSLAGVLVLAGVLHSRALAQDGGGAMVTSPHQPQTAEHKKQENALVAGQNQ